jgi:putative tricarboxylic transport membrane protein
LNNDQWSSALLFLSGLLISGHSVTYTLGSMAAPESGMMPFLSGAAICLFSAIGFLYATARRWKGERWAPVFQGLRWSNCLITMGALAGFLLLLKPLGFFLATALFVGFLFRAIVPQRWPVVIGGAVLTAAAAYLVFEVWLKAQLPAGPFGI